MSDNPLNKKSLKEQLEIVSDSTNSDKNYNASKALISSIPSIGSLAVNFMESYITPPAQRRLYEFLDNLVKELEELKAKSNAVDFSTPIFQTIFMEACQIAIRTHKEQKLESLRNAVLNSSIPNSLDDDRLSMFLTWISDFTSTHIFILKCLHYLDQYEPDELKAQFTNLENNEAMYNQILKDLVSRGLISLREKYITKEDDDDIFSQLSGLSGLSAITEFSTGRSRKEKEIKLNTFQIAEDINYILKDSPYKSRESKTTELGKQFIQFIENPFTRI